jgi:Family of unknown function (DUF6496)
VIYNEKTFNFQEGKSMPRKPSRSRKYGKAAQNAVKKEMRRFKKGTARSGRKGKGGKVKSRKQAIAIALSEARKKGAKVPKKPTAKRGTRSTKRKSTTKKGTRSTSKRKATSRRRRAA